MVRPRSMKKLEALVLAEHKDEVLRVIKDTGAVHFINLSEDAETLGSLESAGAGWFRVEAAEYLSRIENILEALRQVHQAEVDSLGELEPVARKLPVVDEEVKRVFEEIDEKLFFLGERVGSLNTRLSEIRKEREELRGHRETLSKLELMGIGPKDMRALKHVSLFLGTMPAEEVESFTKELAEITDMYLMESKRLDKKHVLLLVGVLSRYEVEVSRALRLRRFEELSIPLRLIPYSLEDAKRLLQEQAERLEREEREVLEELRKIAEAEMASLLRYQMFLSAAKRVDEANLNMLRTRKTYVFSGWVPEERMEEVRRAIEDATKGACVVSFREPEEHELPPTLIRNPPVTKPLEALTTTYGIPNYREIDPTSIVALTFPFIFGFMFGDIGQGLVLVLAGLYVGFRVRRFGEKGRKLGRTLVLCGIMATFMGFVYGSMFGLEAEAAHGESPMQKYLGFTVEPLKVPLLDRFFEGALLASPDRIMRAVYFSIYLGVLLLILGMVLNLINHAIQRELKHALLSPFGVPGIWALLGGSYIVFVKKSFSIPHVLGGVLLPVLLVFLHLLLVERQGMLVSAIETFENSMKYLTNTLSFLRITIIGVVHAALSMMMVQAMFALGDSLLNPAVLLVFIAGNVLIIVMEAFISFVHTLRLHFYEIFSKFYRANGVLFSPLRIMYKEE